jgi:hypothetical protein
MNLDIDKGDGSRGAIRRFADLNIQTAIDKAVSQLGDKHGAAIAMADKDSAKLAIVGRKGDHWSVVAVAEREWNGEKDFQVAVRYSW